ncbi:Suppression of tumorigenicity 5 protein [Liparis tanakae]|uniref:Suppression of tumorigenicity 5 protein n=1 Tax=Liparis tanakae TaxID=230148 RepID=A0A4Z2IDD2_9TELE|nr:Suppression of tumorigenicity 5 protein [Liparis tanakae]
MEAPFPAPGRTITVKNFLPGSGTEVIELCRPSDSRLEHVDFECLFSSLSLRLLLRVFASLLLERRVIFTADKLRLGSRRKQSSASTFPTSSTLSQCCHAVVALLYPFTWQHTYIPVLPPSMLDIVCTPTPFIVGLLSSSLPRLKELPIEEVLVVDLGNSRFLRQLDDEDSILPHKLQAALEHVLDKRKELASEKGDLPNDSSCLSTVVSEAFVRFFVEMVGHYSLFMGGAEREDESISSPASPSPSSSSSSSSPAASFQREAFRKAVTSKSLRRFLEVFMETQMFTSFIQERELRRQGLRGESTRVSGLAAGERATRSQQVPQGSRKQDEISFQEMRFGVRMACAKVGKHAEKRVVKKTHTREEDAHAPLDVEDVEDVEDAEMKMCLEVRTKEDP